MLKFYSICKNYYFYILIVLAVFIPLYPKFPLFNIPGTYVAIRMEDFFIAVTLLVWLVLNVSRLKSLLKENIYQAFILFWIIGGLSLLSGLLITQSVEFHLGLLHWLRRIEYMFLFVAAATSFSTLKQTKIFITAFISTALVVVLYGFGQIWLDLPVISTTNKEFSKGLILYLTNGARVNSTFAGHYDLAVYLSMMLILISSMLFFYRNLLYKTALILLGILGFILLGFTAARVSFITALLGLTLSFWWNKKKILVVILALMAVGLIGLIPDLRHRLVATVTVNLMGGGGPKYNPPPGQITIFTNLNQYPEDSRAALREMALKEATKQASLSGKMAVDTAPGEPINPTELGVSRSWGIRLNVEWPRAINAFLKNPFLGTGYSSLTIATDNDYLRSLGEVGILGTLSLGLIFFILIKRMVLFLDSAQNYIRALSVGTLCLTISLMGSALFIDVLEASKVAEIFWLISGVTWGVIKQRVDSNVSN